MADSTYPILNDVTQLGEDMSDADDGHTVFQSLISRANWLSKLSISPQAKRLSRIKEVEVFKREVEKIIHD